MMKHSREFVQRVIKNNFTQNTTECQALGVYVCEKAGKGAHVVAKINDNK
ncbi:MAG TPA: hypothetical protein VKA09_04550 [Nitrososphaeraceae archaeon]|nr:hypothetical protein [Nitrososphaeraceae archaeon]